VLAGHDLPVHQHSKAEPSTLLVGKETRCFFCGAKCRLLAHRVISLRRGSSVAFGVKRSFSEPRLQNRIYEYAS
jgi:hypothetical protein